MKRKPGRAVVVRTGSVVDPRMPKHASLKLERKPRAKKYSVLAYTYRHPGSGRIVGAGDRVRVR